MMGKHTLNKKIYYHDTDAGGVVYYANYLKYFEEARHEFLFSRGIDLRTWAEKGILFVVKRMSIDYKRPAVYGQEIDIRSSLKEKKKASMIFSQYAERAEVVLVKADTQLACVDKNLSLIAIPENIKF